MKINLKHTTLNKNIEYFKVTLVVELFAAIALLVFALLITQTPIQPKIENVNSQLKISYIDVEANTLAKQTVVLHTKLKLVTDIPHFVTIEEAELIVEPEKQDIGEYQIVFKQQAQNSTGPVRTICNIEVSPKEVDFPLLQEEIEKKLGKNKENFGIYLKDLLRGETIEINPDKIVPTASLVKIPIVTGVLRKIDKGEAKLTDTYPIQNKYKHTNSDALGSLSEGTKVSLERYIEEAIHVSSNTAQYHLRQYLGGTKKLNEIVRNELGVDPYFEDPHQTTAHNVGQVLQGIYSNTLLTKTSADYLLKLMRNTSSSLRQAIPAGIPDIKGVKVASKVGFLFGGREGDVYSDAAIVTGIHTDYILVVINSKAPAYPQGKDKIREISQLIYNALDR